MGWVVRWACPAGTCRAWLDEPCCARHGQDGPSRGRPCRRHGAANPGRAVPGTFKFLKTTIYNRYRDFLHFFSCEEPPNDYIYSR